MDVKMFQTKDSGKRATYESGMVRDTEEGKARFDLLLPKDVPFEQQMLTRFARLMERGAVKYDERNWEKAEGQVELDRYHSSALRHLVQWLCGADDEDHAAAVMFNILAGETVKYKMTQSENAPKNLEPLICNVRHPHKCKEHPMGYWPDGNTLEIRDPYDC